MSLDNQVELLSPSQIKKEPIIDCEYWFRDSESFLLILDLEKKMLDFNLRRSYSICLGISSRLNSDINEDIRDIPWLDLALHKRN